MTEYNTIEVLTEIEHIRQRPGMYIGSTETPLHLIYEVIDNALDEANAGYATIISIVITKHTCTVTDNGRGFPQSEVNGIPAPILACTKLHSGAKFNSNRAYNTSIGLNGVGLVAVNVLSSKMSLVTWRGSKIFYATMNQGLVTEVNNKYNDHYPGCGSSVKFEPDPEIFGEYDLTKLISIIRARLSLALTVVEKCRILLNEEEVHPYQPKELLDSKVDTPIIDIKSKNNDRLVFGYITSSPKDDTYNGAVNLLPVNRGTHINVARKIIQKAWEPYIKDLNKKVLGSDVLVGCSSFISIFTQSPMYTSQTKEVLSSPLENSEELTKEFVTNIQTFLETNPKVRLSLIKKFQDYRESQDRLSNTAYLDAKIQFGDIEDDRINRRISVPKLLDCSSTKMEETELFIVEGDSAVGPMKTTRNPRIHAILPLRGKILNIIDRDVQSIMDNNEIRSIINSVGVGAYTKRDFTKLRYGKIIIETDADEDGKNIRALLIGFFNYAIPDVIAQGNLYYLEVPLYGYYNNNKFIPCFDSEPPPKIKDYKRFKGLGAMNPNEMKEVAFTENRRLIQVTDPDKAVTKLVGGSFLKRKLLIDRGIIVE